MRKIAYVKCEPSEKNFAKLFNFFDGYIEGKMVTPSDKSFEFRCVNMDDRFLENDRDVINALKKGSYSTCQESPSFDNLQVIVDIIVPSDNVVDSFFFRYLIVLKNKLLRFQDVIVISCDQVFYHKISSLFYFESFDDDKTAKLYAYDENSELKIKKFSHKFFPSSEWLPIMSFDKNDVGSLYEVLSSPIGEKEEIIRIYQEYKEDQCNVKKMIERIPRIKQKESYRSFFISCLFYWMDSLNEETIFYIYKYLNTFSTLSLLIFTMELKFRFKCSTDTASNLNLLAVF